MSLGWLHEVLLINALHKNSNITSEKITVGFVIYIHNLLKTKHKFIIYSTYLI